MKYYYLKDMDDYVMLDVDSTYYDLMVFLYRIGLTSAENRLSKVRNISYF